MNVLSIDPGKWLAGAGMFVDDTLVEAKLLRSSSKNPALAAKEIGDLALEMAQRAGVVFDRVLCEEPNIRARKRQKGDPNDLLFLMLVNGAVFHAVPCRKPELVPVNDWKGSADTDTIIKGRLTGDWGGYDPPLSVPPPKLSVEERLILGPKPNHNVVDGVGIGLWGLRRL